MKFFKELDLFGASIKWRLRSTDNFKSYVGAGVSFFVYSLLILKLFSFGIKIFNFGFANLKTYHEFKDEKYQTTDFSNLKFVLLGIDFKKIYYSTQLKYKTENDKNNFTFSEFIEIDSSLNSQLKIQETSCGNQDYREVFYNNQDMKYEENICFEFMKDNNTFILDKNSTYFYKSHEHRIERLLQFLQINIKLKPKMIEFLNNSQVMIPMLIGFLNYRFNNKNYKLEPAINYLAYTLTKEKITIVGVDIRKLSVTHKVELDLFETETYNEEKYFIDKPSEKSITLQRDHYASISNEKYLDCIWLNFDPSEEHHEVTIFTLDDLMAVLGGFLQILLTLSQFFVGFYNEKVSEKILSKVCLEKLDKFQENFNQIKKKYQIEDLIDLKKNKKSHEISLDNFDSNIFEEKIENLQKDIKILNTSKFNKIKINNFDNCEHSLENLTEIMNSTNEEVKEKKIEQFNIDQRSMKKCKKIKKEKSDVDYFKLIDLKFYLNLLSGFEALKYFLFEEINKNNFENISDSFLYTSNCHLLKGENSKKEVMSDLKLSIVDNMQKEFYERFHKNLFENFYV